MHVRGREMAAAGALGWVVLFGGCEAISGKAESHPIVSRVHTLSVHVGDRGTHAAVLRFLKDVLRLPILWGPEEHGERLYAALSGGNIALEPCGPFADIDYATKDFDAMFYGITFEPFESAAASAAQMDRCGILHGGVSTFTIIKDDVLCGQNLGLSLWEIRNKEKFKAQVEERSEQGERAGGPLGIVRVAEVQVGYTRSEAPARWARLLAGAELVETGVWRVNDSLAIRLVHGDVREIRAIVLETHSLERARRYLEQSDLLGAVREGELEIDPGKAFGLRIVLRQG